MYSYLYKATCIDPTHQSHTFYLPLEVPFLIQNKANYINIAINCNSLALKIFSIYLFQDSEAGPMSHFVKAISEFTKPIFF